MSGFLTLGSLTFLRVALFAEPARRGCCACWITRAPPGPKKNQDYFRKSLPCLLQAIGLARRNEIIVLAAQLDHSI